MAATKIRNDKYGLYVRTNGQVYRPVATPYGHHIAHAVNSREDGTSALVEGQAVSVHHKSQTPFAVVKVGGIEEWWHSHGVYLGKFSDQCWTPKLEARK